jgi:hypothetical protein
MSLFSSKNLIHYAVALGLIVIASYVGNKFKNFIENKDEEYELIRKYLLNDSPLYGYDKPKLWIHSKYEYNARKWQSFMSRSSTNLNQPYLHLTIKTIINQCGSDFNVCLIDDETFSRLIPGWDINVSKLAEPKKSDFRELGMAQLVYIYGGMVVPNSFVCLRNLAPLYTSGVGKDNNMPFVAENVNDSTDLMYQKRRLAFTSDVFVMGAPKRNPIIRQYVDYLKKRNQNPHYSEESLFLGRTSHWCNIRVEDGKMNRIPGELIGVKTMKGKPVRVEDLMEEAALDLSQDLYGVYIPEDQLLLRTKYQWFPVISSEELLNSNIIIVKYLIAAMVNSLQNKTVEEEEMIVSNVISI